MREQVRRAFVAAAAPHLDVAADPDRWFHYLTDEMIAARREGRPQPHPWFVGFCARQFLRQFVPDEQLRQRVR